MYRQNVYLFCVLILYIFLVMITKESYFEMGNDVPFFNAILTLQTHGHFYNFRASLKWMKSGEEKTMK